MRKSRKLLLLLFLYTFFTPGYSVAQSFTLIIEVAGILEISGELQVGLFNNEDAFLEIGAEFSVANVKVDSTTTQLRFTDVPKGEYAISLYHDIDSNGEINKNFIGIPTEPYGISNDAWRRLAAPRWEEALFVVKMDTTIVINLKH